MADHCFRILSRHPLITCCVIGFFSGALLDIDHVPLWLFHVRYPVFIQLDGIRTVAQGANLHGVALVGGGALCACAGGYLFKLVLENREQQ